MPLIDTEKAWKTAQRIYSDPVLLHAIKNVLSSTEIIEAYTGGQISEIIRKAEQERAENGTLRTGVEFLKNCINCKIRNTCPRHCGKVVHGCDHWEYGDPMKEAAPVVHGRLVFEKNPNTADTWNYRCTACDGYNGDDPAYCPNCGARMDGDGNA